MVLLQPWNGAIEYDTPSDQARKMEVSQPEDASIAQAPNTAIAGFRALSAP
jgi:hypothetical protein